MSRSIAMAMFTSALILRRLWSLYWLHRAAVPGTTKIIYSWSWPADLAFSKSAHPKAGTGTIIDFEYEFVGGNHPCSYELENALPGKYLSNRYFPSGYIVRPDDGGERVLVPTKNAKLVAGYVRKIPRFHELTGDLRRVGDLPIPVVAKCGDDIHLVIDPPHVTRTVGRVFFTSIGTPEYEVGLTEDELATLQQRLKAEADARGRAYRLLHDFEPLAWVRAEDFEVVQQ